MQPHQKPLTHFMQEPYAQIKSASPCIMVIFGATGDLTKRKLIPAIYNLLVDGALPQQFVCVGFARRDKSHEEFRNDMREGISHFSRSQPIDEEIWKNFSEKLFYHCSTFDGQEGYTSLKLFLEKLDAQFGTKGNRIFYLSTPPSYFTTIVENLYKAELLKRPGKENHGWSRIIVEKPFGRDLESAKQLQKELTQYLDESQIWRIDHYLGKETVQNLLMFRFSNPIFEAIWNNHHIDHVQITVAEDIGIGTRGKLWEEAGILRDIIQNHMMQLLTLVAMEPPANMRADSIRDEKVKVMQAIRPLPQDNLESAVQRGQYGPGFIRGETVKGYRQEQDVDPQSTIETYLSMQLYIDNWRWSGVPFFVRAGKRLPKRITEIAITFKNAPGFLFQQKWLQENVLAIRIQPDEGISLKMNCKVPGLNGALQPVKMDFQYESYFGKKTPEAYERLLCDCMSADNTLFAGVDEVLSSWKLLTPILEYWKYVAPEGFPNYPAGTWGPPESEWPLAKNGRKWRII